MRSGVKYLLTLASMCTALTAAPAAWANDEIPSLTLSRDAFNAARNVA